MSRRDRRATRVDARSRPGRLAEQPPRGIGDHRAKVVVMVMVMDMVMVIELIGAPAVDATVARSPVKTVDASRLLGGSVITTGVAPMIAQTLVTLEWIGARSAPSVTGRAGWTGPATARFTVTTRDGGSTS